MTDMFSTLDNPRLEFAMEVRLQFPRVQTIVNTPMGGNRSAVYVDGGTFEGPRIRGKAVPGSGGDYAYFRPDDVAVFDARYMLEEEDGTLFNPKSPKKPKPGGLMDRLHKAVEAKQRAAKSRGGGKSGSGGYKQRKRP